MHIHPITPVKSNNVEEGFVTLFLIIKMFNDIDVASKFESEGINI